MLWTRTENEIKQLTSWIHRDKQLNTHALLFSLTALQEIQPTFRNRQRQRYNWMLNISERNSLIDNLACASISWYNFPWKLLNFVELNWLERVKRSNEGATLVDERIKCPYVLIWIGCLQRKINLSQLFTRQLYANMALCFYTHTTSSGLLCEYVVGFYVGQYWLEMTNISNSFHEK